MSVRAEGVSARRINATRVAISVRYVNERTDTSELATVTGPSLDACRAQVQDRVNALAQEDCDAALVAAVVGQVLARSAGSDVVTGDVEKGTQ